MIAYKVKLVKISIHCRKAEELQVLAKPLQKKLN